MQNSAHNSSAHALIVSPIKLQRELYLATKSKFELASGFRIMHATNPESTHTKSSQ
jgi:hypothetical protein